MLPAYVRYGIRVGQTYTAADGSNSKLTVVDVTTYANCDDVVVYDSINKAERRIDAFKLAMVRYKLYSEGEAVSTASLPC
jgi:hypothetical protein